MAAGINRIPLHWIFWTNALLIFVVVVLVIAWYRDARYITATLPEFIETIIAWSAALTGVIVWLSGGIWVTQYVYNLIQRRPEPRKLAHEQLVRMYLPGIVDRFLRPAIHSLTLTGMLIMATGLLFYRVFVVDPPFLPPGGPIIVTPTVLSASWTRHHKHVYIVVKHVGDEPGKWKPGGLAVLNEQAVELKSEFIPLSTRLDRSAPNCVAVAPSRKKLFVTDAAGGRLHIIDETWKPQAVAIGRQPRCVAISPDERKAYVSNEQPAPYGTISVFDIEKGVVSRTIHNVNCAEGIAVSRDGRRLYVATQCGGDHDPLFVIDTSTDKVIASIPDVAVGSAPAVSPDGKRIYVSRNDPNPQGSNKFLLSVYSTVDHRPLQHLSMQDAARAIAFTADGANVFVATGPAVEILDGNTLQKINEFRTCAPEVPRDKTWCWPIGIAVSDRGALYMLTEFGHVRFTGLAGLIKLP